MATSTMAQKLDFSGKRILITGGGRGIGLQMARTFTQLNGTVIVLEKNADLIASLKSELPSAEVIPLDLTNWEETKKAVESVLPIHHLINNAAVVEFQGFLDIDPRHIDSIFNVNFKSYINVGQVVAKGMISTGIQGTIVNMSSLCSTSVIDKEGMYCCSKASVNMLTKSMALELGPHKIRVNAIAPGFVNTELVSTMPEDLKKEILEPGLQRQIFHETIDTAEIAQAAVFLSSDMSKMVTGTTLQVDAGYGVF